MIPFIIIIFFIGYLFIILEHKIKIDKAASALLMGVSCWVIYILYAADPHTVNHQLAEHISDIAGILFFLIGAMTIVELIDLHEGFQVIIDAIKTTNKRTLVIIISFITFFLSAILDNLTTAIVMCTLVAKILSDQRDKNIVMGMVIIAANSGGAWSPIGDVTTTMLWIGNQITAVGIMKSIFLPSLVSVCVPLLFFLTKMKGTFSPKIGDSQILVEPKERNIIFYSGISLLIFVPIFKTFTHLAPYMGMMFAVGIVWLISETLHKKKPNSSEQQPSIFVALEKVDLPSILFFMGILLAVSALQSTSILQQMATSLSSKVQNENIIVIGIGLLSAIFDNVPLVAAIQGMFTTEQYPTGHFFWNFLAYCAGTGGSILIIGSAAGVAAMGIEKISFFWYLKNVSLSALLGYLAGAITTILIG